MHGVKVHQKDGAWYVFINHRGKRKAKRIGSDKKTAPQEARKIEAKLALGEFALADEKPQQSIFADYARDWLDQYVMVACKPSSGRVLRGIVRNHLIPYFGSSDLRRITRTQVKSFITQKHRRYSRRYVRDLVRTLHTILDHAVEEEILDCNPATKMGRYLPEQNIALGQEINPFTSQKLTQYLSVVREHYPDHYPYFCV